MRRLLCLVHLLVGTQVLAQVGVTSEAAPASSTAVAEPDAGALRQQIAREKAASGALLKQREQACREGFWVNRCLEQARSEHRQAMAELRRQQVALEQAERQQRSVRKLERLQAREQQRPQEPGRPAPESSN